MLVLTASIRRANHLIPRDVSMSWRKKRFMRSKRLPVAAIAIFCYSIALACSAPLCFSQQYKFDALNEPKGDSGYEAVWDARLERVIFHRDTSDPALPAIKIVGNDEITSIYPLKDFPGANFIDIWAVSGSPSGDIVASVILGYAPRHDKKSALNKSLLLTYDKAGTLRKVWDIDPYHHHYVAVDSSGNAYGFGDADATSDDYPLLIKYTLDGNVEFETFKSGQFPMKDDVIVAASANGTNALFAKNGRVYLWIAATYVLYTFATDGHLVEKTSLDKTINELESTHNSKALVSAVDVDSHGQVVVEAVLFPAAEGQIASGIFQLTEDGSIARWVQPLSNDSNHRFLGLYGDDEAAFLEHSGKIVFLRPKGTAIP